jgi:hypothetical protein
VDEFIQAMGAVSNRKEFHKAILLQNEAENQNKLLVGAVGRAVPPGNARPLELTPMLGEVSESTLHSANDLLQSARTANAGK